MRSGSKASKARVARHSAQPERHGRAGALKTVVDRSLSGRLGARLRVDSAGDLPRCAALARPRLCGVAAGAGLGIGPRPRSPARQGTASESEARRLLRSVRRSRPALAAPCCAALGISRAPSPCAVFRRPRASRQVLSSGPAGARITARVQSGGPSAAAPLRRPRRARVAGLERGSAAVTPHSIRPE